MLRLLRRGFAVGKPTDPHLPSIAKARSTEELFAYLEKLKPPLTLSQQTLSLKTVSRLFRETPTLQQAFEEPLYKQIRSGVVQYFADLNASQALDLLFWLRVCRQNGKVELSHNDVSSLLARVETLCQEKRFTPQGLASLYLNITLMNRTSPVVEEHLESSLSSTSGIIELKQVLVGMVNAHFVPKNLVVKALSILQEFDWQQLPIGRVVEMYRLLASLEKMSLTLTTTTVLNRSAASLYANLDSVNNTELLDVIDIYRNFSPPNIHIINKALDIVNLRVKTKCLPPDVMLRLLDEISGLKPVKWLGFDPRVTIELLHYHAMRLNRISPEVVDLAVSGARRCELPVLDRFKVILCLANCFQVLQLADGSKLLPEERSLIQRVHRSLPVFDSNSLIRHFLCVSAAKHKEESSDLAGLHEALFSAVSACVGTDALAAINYLSRVSQERSTEQQQLHAMTKSLFDSAPALISELQDQTFIVWRTLQCANGLEREWREMIMRCDMPRFDILKFIRLAREEDNFACVMFLVDREKKPVQDEAVLCAAKFLSLPQRPESLSAFASLLSQLPPDCCFSEAFRFNMKRIFTIINSNRPQFHSFLIGIRDNIFSKEDNFQDRRNINICVFLSDYRLLSVDQAEKVVAALRAKLVVDHTAIASVVWPYIREPRFQSLLAPLLTQLSSIYTTTSLDNLQHKLRLIFQVDNDILERTEINFAQSLQSVPLSQFPKVATVLKEVSQFSPSILIPVFLTEHYNSLKKHKEALPEDYLEFLKLASRFRSQNLEFFAFAVGELWLKAYNLSIEQKVRLMLHLSDCGISIKELVTDLRDIAAQTPEALNPFAAELILAIAQVRMESAGLALAAALSPGELTSRETVSAWAAGNIILNRSVDLQSLSRAYDQLPAKHSLTAADLIFLAAAKRQPDTSVSLESAFLIPMREAAAIRDHLSRANLKFEEASGPAGLIGPYYIPEARVFLWPISRYAQSIDSGKLRWDFQYLSELLIDRGFRVVQVPIPALLQMSPADLRNQLGVKIERSY